MIKQFTEFEQLPLTLNADEIAKVLGISRAGAYRLFHTKGFPRLTIGKRMVCPKERFLHWLNQQSCECDNGEE